MRATWTIAALAGGFVLCLPGAAHAQDDGGLPPGFDLELAQLFEAELISIMSDNGVDIDPENLDELIGEPGDLDLPPGEAFLLFTGADAAALASEDIEGEGDSELTGPCMGLTISFAVETDEDGNEVAEVIDMAGDFEPSAPPIDLLEYYESDGTDAKAAFTASNPYKVDVDGFVVYAGIAEDSTGSGPTNHTWEITTFGAALDSGGDDNPDRENRNAGGVNLGEQLPAPAKVNALFKIEGDMVADNGFRCVGSGYFETIGGAPIAQIAGGVLVLLGGLGAIFNARPARTWRSG